MTDTPQDPYRVMAEKIWKHIDSKQIAIHPDTIEVIADAIRDHTVVPEMVEFIRKIASGDIEDLIERKSELAEEAKPLLAKAERIEP